MKRELFILLALLSIGMAKGYSKWDLVKDRYNVADYEGMRTILDTINLANAADSALSYYWLGEYYYWRSYEDRNCVDTARGLFESAIRCKSEYRLKTAPVGYCHLHLGELSYLAKDYKEGINHLNNALRGYPFNFRAHPKDPILKGLGMCYAMLGDYQKALLYLDSCKSGTKGAYSATRMKGKVYAMKGDTALSIRCYNEFVSSIREEVRDSFLNLNKADKESWWMSVRPFITDCWRLEKAAPELLYDVALITKSILLQQDSALLITHTDINQALSKEEIAIEWMTYDNNGCQQLGAVLTRADGTTMFVRSGNTAWFNSLAEKEDEIYEDDSCATAIWSEEMMQAIGNAKKIYFAPDGILNQIGIEYMFPDTAVRLFRLSSTRELLKKRRDNQKYASAAIFGDVDYDDTSIHSTWIENDDEAYHYIKKFRFKASKLIHSKEECDSITKTRHQMRDTMILGSAATEEAFRNVAGSYELLNISTHGYCRTAARFESSDFPRREVVDHSLSESGLLFSGFNSEQKDHQSVSDGIVSARELSSLDLRKVDLCIVSACEGAKGRASVDGTYGIQRGLKAAGVGCMILSLWEVDDLATTLFMTYLYKAMENGESVHEAFREARENLRYHKEAYYVAKAATRNFVKKKYNRPRYYNAFILVDL